MKRLSSILFISIFFLLFEEVKSQSNNNNIQGLPLKSGNSILFGKDIIINNDSTQNQRQVAICSAFNGWLYAAYTYIGTVGAAHVPVLIVMKSTDSGITWTNIIFFQLPFDGSQILTLEIAITGYQISNLKLFLGFVVSLNPNPDPSYGTLFLYRYNGETALLEEALFGGSDIGFISLATDYSLPANGSNPQSFSFIYSKNFSGGDSLIFRSSSNGGLSLDNWQSVTKTTNHIHRVALNYGRSSSWNSGRYFAVWEEKSNFTSNLGHIYTSHTEPDFNSSFTTPVKLDSIDASALNKVKNPTIACQYNNIDNDSSNLTEVVLFDKYILSQNRYEIEGLYNKKATTSLHFTPFSLNSSSDSRQQPSVNFNPFDSSFMVTYYDSTTSKLPFLRKNFNMINPDSWQIISSGYNDSSNLAAPYPRVILSMSQQQGACVWSAEGDGGNGIAIFDAPYSTYTGISDNSNTLSKDLFKVYPNPCNKLLTLDFKLITSGRVTIVLYDLTGNSLTKIIDRIFAEGRHRIEFDVSGFPSGIYYYTFSNDHFTRNGKVIVMY